MEKCEVVFKKRPKIENVGEKKIDFLTFVFMVQNVLSVQSILHFCFQICSRSCFYKKFEQMKNFNFLKNWKKVKLHGVEKNFFSKTNIFQAKCFSSAFKYDNFTKKSFSDDGAMLVVSNEDHKSWQKIADWCWKEHNNFKEK